MQRLRRQDPSDAVRALAAPDEQRLVNLQQQLAAAQEAAETADARLHELQEQVPQLDEERRARQQDTNAQGHKQADLSEAKVWKSLLWRHADESPSRSAAVEELADMLKKLFNRR